MPFPFFSSKRDPDDPSGLEGDELIELYERLEAEDAARGPRGVARPRRSWLFATAFKTTPPACQRRKKSSNAVFVSRRATRRRDRGPAWISPRTGSRRGRGRDADNSGDESRRRRGCRVYILDEFAQARGRPRKVLAFARACSDDQTAALDAHLDGLPTAADDEGERRSFRRRARSDEASDASDDDAALENGRVGVGNEFGTHALAAMDALRHEARFCDCVLLCGDGARLPCHRVALCAASAYFRSLLVSRRDDDGDVPLLSTLSSPGVAAAVDYASARRRLIRASTDVASRWADGTTNQSAGGLARRRGVAATGLRGISARHPAAVLRPVAGISTWQHDTTAPTRPAAGTARVYEY